MILTIRVAVADEQQLEGLLFRHVFSSLAYVDSKLPVRSDIYDNPWRTVTVKRFTEN